MSVTRDAILDCLGTIPDRPDPAVETVSTTAADGFERRLVEYDGEPGERIRAYLLVPDDVNADDEHPGVLAVHPHAGEFTVGKSDPASLSETVAYHYNDDQVSAEESRRNCHTALLACECRPSRTGCRLPDCELRRRTCAKRRTSV
ncbi:hypothetical protein [Haloterrigena gelatinilytica]|uniref:hypothetical protein n=1 Tax=Haloterrigena gelatinilytica TaxID=2741724 RepID=UPI0020C71A75|nr:hypothetical protein [Haloterrigena gelatinilytica]